jgi:hypothetical protein
MPRAAGFFKKKFPTGRAVPVGVSVAGSVPANVQLRENPRMVAETIESVAMPVRGLVQNKT